MIPVTILFALYKKIITSKVTTRIKRSERLFTGSTQKIENSPGWSKSDVVISNCGVWTEDLGYEVSLELGICVTGATSFAPSSCARSPPDRVGREGLSRERGDS